MADHWTEEWPMDPYITHQWTLWPEIGSGRVWWWIGGATPSERWKPLPLNWAVLCSG